MKCGKGGIFALDGVPIPTGPDSFRFTPLVSTAAFGRVRFDTMPSRPSSQALANTTAPVCA
jgi:hypothetical protein